MDDGRDRDKAVARGKVKPVIVAVEAMVNEARNNVKKRIYIVNKTV